MSNYILADNQEVTRFAVESLVRSNADNEVRIAHDIDELFTLLGRYENAVVVLDYTLFDFTSEDQLLVAAERFSMASWVLFSDDLTPQFIDRMLHASHAFSVVFKTSSLHSLKHALEDASSGKRYICQRAMDLILTKDEDEQPCPLTRTEMEVMRAITQGKTTKEIAEERFSSIHTITTHRKNIFRKLKVNTAHELLRHAMRMGWVDPIEFYI